jgi:hypothetical protein
MNSQNHGSFPSPAAMVFVDDRPGGCSTSTRIQWTRQAKYSTCQYIFHSVGYVILSLKRTVIHLSDVLPIGFIWLSI